MADNNTVARPYAQAIFEIATAGGALGEWSKSLATAGQLLRDRELVEYLADPAFSDAQRLEFLTGLFDKAGSSMLAGTDAKGTNFLKLLIENDRIAVLPEIVENTTVTSPWPARIPAPFTCCPPVIVRPLIVMNPVLARMTPD